MALGQTRCRALTLHAICRRLAGSRKRDDLSVQVHAHGPAADRIRRLSAQWGGMAARLVRASAGRHCGGSFADHRLIFYTAGPTQTECGCDGIVQRRLQVPRLRRGPGRLRRLLGGHAPADMVSVRLDPGFMTAHGGRWARPAAGPKSPRSWAPATRWSSTSCARWRRSWKRRRRPGRLYADSLAVGAGDPADPGVLPCALAGRQTLSKPQLRRIVDYVGEQPRGRADPGASWPRWRDQRPAPDHPLPPDHGPVGARLCHRAPRAAGPQPCCWAANGPWPRSRCRPASPTRATWPAGCAGCSA